MKSLLIATKLSGKERKVKSAQKVYLNGFAKKLYCEIIISAQRVLFLGAPVSLSVCGWNYSKTKAVIFIKFVYVAGV